MTGLLKVAQQLSPIGRTLDVAQGAVDNASSVSGLTQLGAPAAAWATRAVAPRVAAGVTAAGTAAGKLFVPLAAASMGADMLRGVADPRGARDRLDEATQGTGTLEKTLGLIYGGFAPSSIGATINETGDMVRAKLDQGAAERSSQWTREQLAKPGLPKRYAKYRTQAITKDPSISPLNPLRMAEATQGLAPGSTTQPLKPVEPGMVGKSVNWLNANRGKVLAGAGGLALLTYLLSRRRKKNDEEELARRGL